MCQLGGMGREGVDVAGGRRREDEDEEDGCAWPFWLKSCLVIRSLPPHPRMRCGGLCFGFPGAWWANVDERFARWPWGAGLTNVDERFVTLDLWGLTNVDERFVTRVHVIEI